MRLETKHTQHRTVDLSESEVTEGANNAQSRGNLHENTPEELGFIVRAVTIKRGFVSEGNEI